MSIISWDSVICTSPSSKWQLLIYLSTALTTNIVWEMSLFISWFSWLSWNCWARASAFNQYIIINFKRWQMLIFVFEKFCCLPKTNLSHLYTTWFGWDGVISTSAYIVSKSTLCLSKNIDNVHEFCYKCYYCY